MIISKIKTILILPLFLVVLCACQPSVQRHISDADSQKDLKLDILLNDMFYHQESFNSSVKAAQAVDARDNIQAIVVPHHLVASTYIADLIKMSSGRDIDEVIIIGPNHENIGNRPVSTALLNWETPFGTVEADRELVESFVSDMGIKQHPEIFTYEHSVGAQVSFVKYYFSKAKILPLAVSAYAEMQEVEKISQWLAEHYNKNTLIIFSIDFSHYLDKDSADKKDEVTRQLILDRDINNVLELHNTEYVDSPASLAIALAYANLQDLDTNIIYQGNSFDFLRTKPIETTSYFGISFSQK